MPRAAERRLPRSEHSAGASPQAPPSGRQAQTQRLCAPSDLPSGAGLPWSWPLDTPHAIALSHGAAPPRRPDELARRRECPSGAPQGLARRAREQGRLQHRQLLEGLERIVGCLPVIRVGRRAGTRRVGGAGAHEEGHELGGEVGGAPAEGLHRETCHLRGGAAERRAGCCLSTCAPNCATWARKEDTAGRCLDSNRLYCASKHINTTLWVTGSVNLPVRLQCTLLLLSISTCASLKFGPAVRAARSPLVHRRH